MLPGGFIIYDPSLWDVVILGCTLTQRNQLDWESNTTKQVYQP